jgi:bacteriocin biosynthesis cyclodehydratase domain-containing protein
MERPRVSIVADGGFGRALAGTVRALLGGGRCSVSPPGEGLGAFFAEAGFAMRASWRDVRSEFEAFAAAADAARVPWLAVAAGPGHIRVGPVVVSGAAPCHACFLRRVRQHEADGRAEEIQRAYEARRGLGVNGYAPHHVALAAGQALSLCGQASGPGTLVVGEVRFIDCQTDEVARLEIAPAQGCGTCDPGHAALAWAARRQRQLRDLASGPEDT